ncbi:MAG TPA: hypothetical protein VIU39_02140 [Anaerolineales bacterium]
MNFVTLPVAAAPNRDHISLPTLEEFIAQLQDGNRKVLRGVYVPGILADPVLQQVTSMDVFDVPGTITQFGTAAWYGVIGLLAHNWSAGQDFQMLTLGQPVLLVYGDGHVERYWVSEIQRYQATTPQSPLSQFTDLDTGKGTDAEGVFRKVYMGRGHVTFQTCIEKDGEWAWGRLFVIAEPEYPMALRWLQREGELSPQMAPQGAQYAGGLWRPVYQARSAPR